MATFLPDQWPTKKATKEKNNNQINTKTIITIQTTRTQNRTTHRKVRWNLSWATIPWVNTSIFLPYLPDTTSDIITSVTHSSPLFMTLRARPLSFLPVVFPLSHFYPTCFFPSSPGVSATLSSLLSTLMRLFLSLAVAPHPYYCHYIHTSTSASLSHPPQNQFKALADKGVAWTLASLDPPLCSPMQRIFSLN